MDVPLQLGDRIIGVLVVEREKPDAFAEDDFEILTAAATQASIAIGRAAPLPPSAAEPTSSRPSSTPWPTSPANSS